MSVPEIDSVRTRYSKASQGKAWTDSYDEMAKKTVLRRLFKMLPVSIELAEALKREDEKSHEIIDADYVIPDFQPDVDKYKNALAEDGQEQSGASQDLTAYRNEFVKRLSSGKKAPESCGADPMAWAKNATSAQLATALTFMA
jgi:recombination protein RecT